MLELIFWLGSIDVDNIDELEGVGEVGEMVLLMLLWIVVVDDDSIELEIFTWEALGEFMTVASTVELPLFSTEGVGIIFVVSICIGADGVSVCIDIGVDSAIIFAEEMTEVEEDWLSNNEEETLPGNNTVDPWNLLKVELESFLESEISIIEVAVGEEVEETVLLPMKTDGNIAVSSIILLDSFLIRKELCVTAPPIKMFKTLK